MKILFVAVKANDRPPMDDDALWDQVANLFDPATSGPLRFGRLADATEGALVEALSASEWDVLHIVTHTEERQGAYSAIALQATDGRSRFIPVPRLASMLVKFPSVKLLVLQSPPEGGSGRRPLSAALVELGVPAALCAASLRGRSQRLFLMTLYTELLAGTSTKEVEKKFAAECEVSWVTADPDLPVPAARASHPSRDASAPPLAPAHIETSGKEYTASIPGARPSPSSAAFISYSRVDFEFALRLAQDLKACDVSVWLDKLDIKFGEKWDEAIEHALTVAPCILLILSPASVASGNVMDEANFAIEKNRLLVPILYKDCERPYRLLRFQYVDFRSGYGQGLESLRKHLSPDRGGR